MAKKIEHKLCEFEVSGVELKSDDGQTNRAEFSGYASVYGNKDLGNDIVAAGAFAKSLAKNKGMVPILIDHTASIEKQAGINIEASEDERGLKVKGQLNLDTNAGKTVHALLKQAGEVGYKTGLSIGYSVSDFEWDDKNRVRTIKSADLWEYSVVVFPMNPKATVTAVKTILESGKADEIAEIKRRIESHLREEEGFSRSEAEAFVSKGFCAFRDESIEQAVKAIAEMTKRIKS
jgi:HK97 family phage prohead protease